MIRIVLLIASVLAGRAVQAETRCGWYHHPTPGWHYLQDADGEWWFSESAQPPAIGYAAVPGFESSYDQAFDDRVRIDYAGRITDYSYGFSCACADGIFRGDTVISVSRLTERPIAACEQDPNLPDARIQKE